MLKIKDKNGREDDGNPTGARPGSCLLNWRGAVGGIAHGTTMILNASVIAEWHEARECREARGAKRGVRRKRGSLDLIGSWI